MSFYVGWKPRVGQAPDAGEKGLEVFTRWTPPQGVEFKGMWGRADGGGFCVCEAASAEAIFEATAPWAGAFLDYDITPIVEMKKGVELQQKANRVPKGLTPEDAASRAAIEEGPPPRAPELARAAVDDEQG